jgi:hypothetical protein
MVQFGVCRLRVNEQRCGGGLAYRAMALTIWKRRRVLCILVQEKRLKVSTITGGAICGLMLVSARFWVWGCKHEEFVSCIALSLVLACIAHYALVPGVLDLHDLHAS